MANFSKRLFSVCGKTLLPLLFFAALLQGAALAQSSTPVITGLLPRTVKAGSAGFTLVVLGAQFVNGAVVQWDGMNRTTNYFSASTLEAIIPDSDLENPRAVEITVVNPGSIVSNSYVFTVITSNPVPVLTGLIPSSVLTGGPAFNLTVTGHDFTAQSVVQWDGENLTTAFVDDKTLVAVISSELIEESGTVQITVLDDAPGGQVSSPRIFTIRDFSTMYFPQVAVDGSYTTVFTIVNTGAESDSGSLVLSDPLGNPFIVVGSYSSGAIITSSVFPISVPAGGTTILTVNTPGVPTSTPKSGWARLESSRSLLSGVATFQTTENGVLTSIAGVLSTQPMNSVTIPVDNNAAVGRRTGFAVANPGENSVNIKLVLLDESGYQLDSVSPAELNPLLPHTQIARFLDQFLPSRNTFKGSMILISQGGGYEFVPVALLINRGLTSQGVMSVIPVVAGHSSVVK